MDQLCTRCLLEEGLAEKEAEIAALIPYIPRRLIKRIEEASCCFFEQQLEYLQGVVVYFDLVGFTPLVFNYIKSGKGPIEQLSKVFFTYYGLIIDPVQKMGGSLYQFAGDSLLIAFEKHPGETKEENWLRAWSAVQIMAGRSSVYDRDHCKENGFSLIPKIGVGRGAYYQITIGDRDRFITPIIAGEAVNEAIACEKKCAPRTIIIGSGAWEEVCRVCQPADSIPPFTRMEDGFYLTVPADSWESQAEEDILAEGVPFVTHSRYFYKRALTFIAPQIRQQITANYSRFSGEYREVTCVMMRIDGDFIDNFENELFLSRGVENLRSVYRLLQDEVQRFGGFMLKPDISDKGNVFPVLFGTPLALENKEKMAILFAKSLLNRSHTTACIRSISAGIATGKLYCGELGAQIRRDYSVVGVTVNLAARLMMYETGGIYIDDTTGSQVRSFCTLEEQTGIPLKGFEGTQSVYKVISTEPEQKAAGKTVKLIGRRNELALLIGKYELSRSGRAWVCGIVGDAGMGKTLLVDEFVNSIMRKNNPVYIIRGYCYQYEQRTVFFPWRKILYSLFSIPEKSGEADTEFIIRSQFKQYLNEEEQIWVAAFLIMMGCRLEEPAQTASIDAGIKQAKIFALIRLILLKKAEQRPLVIIMDDIHWIDDVSLKLIEFIGHNIQDAPIYIVLLTREEEKLSGFEGGLNVQIIRLNRLDEKSARELIAFLLNLKQEEELLTEKLLKASDCNPFFIENIVLNLINQGDIKEDITGKRYLAKDIDQITIPSSIQSIILSRLDNLRFEEQIIIKTASVIGRTFIPEVLKAIIPDTIEKSEFTSALLDFEDHDLIFKEDERSANYIFKHITIRDVVYNTLLERTRRELNKALLVYMEKNFAGDITAGCERLAYHSIEAGEYESALKYSVMAARKAEKQFANINAINHYITALSMIKLLDSVDCTSIKDEVILSLAAVYRRCGNYEKALEMYRVALENEGRSWYRAALIQGMGHCYQERGQFMTAIETIEKSLSLLGKKPPRSAGSIYLSIGKEVLTEIFHYVCFHNELRQTQGEKRKIIEKRSENLQVLSKLYYFGKVEQLGWATITNFNTASFIKNNLDSYCRACADYAVTLVSAGFRRAGLYHFELAEIAAARTDNLTTKSIFKARYAYYFLFNNRPESSITLLEEAVAHFRSAGEMWELMTATGALGQNYFLVSNLEKAEKSYLEAERVATQLNSPMHIGWAYNKVPFIRYLCGEINSAEAISALHKGIEFSEETHDHMTLCIHYGHLCYIAEKEKNAEDALHYALEVLRENRLYTVNIPHVKISLVNAAEALLFVLESGNAAVSRRRIITEVRLILKKARHLGKTFSLIEGPVWRAKARLALYLGNKTKAGEYSKKALSLLAKTPFRWEYANALLFTSLCIPQKRQKYRKQASQLLADCNMMGEINRIPSLYSK